MSTATLPDTRKITSITLSFEDGSAHIMKGTELETFQTWLQNIHNLLSMAAALIPKLPVEVPQTGILKPVKQ